MLCPLRSASSPESGRSRWVHEFGSADRGAWEWLELGAWDLGFDPYNLQMVFGPPPPDLMPGALNAVDICLAIQPGERVALIADEASGAVAASLEPALDAARGADRRGAHRIGLVAPDAERRRRECSTRSSRRMPAFCACSRRKGSCRARMAIVGLVERRRIRYAHMVGVTPQIMREGMRADYRLVDRLSQQLCERMRTRGHAHRPDRRAAPTSPRPSIRRWRG